MAGISVSKNFVLPNPTLNYIPTRGDVNFIDSNIFAVPNDEVSLIGIGRVLLNFDLTNNTFYIGDQTPGSQNYLSGSAGQLRLVAPTLVYIDCTTKLELKATLSGSAGGASGQHLPVTVNGVNYKLQLLNS